MKYHKIPGVEKSVCTAEQKIAYNLAFRAHISFQTEWDKARRISAVCADDLLRDIIKIEMENLKRDIKRSEKKTHFNVDAIQSCLNAGLAAYLDSAFVAWDFESIGEAFPAYYLEA